MYPDLTFIELTPILLRPDQLPHTLNEYFVRAYEAMSEQNRAYFLAGAGSGETLLANEGLFRQAEITPRMLRDSRGGSTQTNLLGNTLSAPLLIAPFAYHRLLNPTGEVATAQGAEAQSVKMIMSAQSSQSIDNVRAAGPDSDWFQLHWMGSKQATLELSTMAMNAGFRTLVLTIDAPVQGVRDNEIEAGFRLPPDIEAVNLAPFSAPRFSPLTDEESIVFDRIAHTLPSWEDVAWMQRMRFQLGRRASSYPTTVGGYWIAPPRRWQSCPPSSHKLGQTIPYSWMEACAVVWISLSQLRWGQRPFW